MVTLEKKAKRVRRLTNFFSKTLLSPKIFNRGISYNYVCSTRCLEYTQLEDAIDLETNYNRLLIDKQEVFNNISIGFSFNFNGTNYEQVSICENGYIKLGKLISLPTHHTLSSYYGDSNVLSAFGTRLRSNDKSRLLYEVNGALRERLLTIDWRNYCFIGAGDINFHIKLHEKNHLITFTYGVIKSIAPVCAQIGLRGKSAFDLNNLLVVKKENTWLKPRVSFGRYSYCEVLIGTTPFFCPISGLTYAWIPS